MHPYLFDWVVAGHHLRPPTYGILLAVAFSSAYFLALWRAIKLHENPKHIENLFLLVVIGSIIGSRLFHVLFEEFAYYWQNPLKIFAVWEGGYTFYGALVMALLFVFLYTRKRNLNFLQFGDIAAASTALGLFIGRLGCFFAGCCWGKPTSLPWGVTFKNPDAFTSVHTISLHPTQVYEALAGLVLFIYLHWRFRHRTYQGQLLFHGLIFYAIARYIIEMFRGDDYRGFLFGGSLSYAQFVSLVILPLASVGMFLYSRVKR